MKLVTAVESLSRGRIFSLVRTFYEWAVSDLDKSMHIPQWVKVAHSSFIEASHTTKNTASARGKCTTRCSKNKFQSKFAPLFFSKLQHFRLMKTNINKDKMV
jgi:hypothetical protein